ncbi:acetyltransferase [Chryseotalea sanaruensis]|uniref:Acetyltransferase n=1 Tax=Chryseotalea sanaruensis TaxID=2482724 RepID=A0A401U8F1_9BACT|nr:lysophospholipid acyltransferase family protein [Chryseotalea sanaruensis]GCC51156.1 acetyltransferase [Chryseotalea sanaruensis]
MWLLKLLARLPFFVLYLFSDFLFFISYRIVGYRKKLVRQNIRNSLTHLSEQEILNVERRFYQNLCDYAVETIKLIGISKDELQKRIRYINPELMEKFTANGQSVVLLSSHTFNWEWLLVAGSISLPAPVDFVYQPVKNSFFDSFILKARSRFGAYAVKRNELARELIKRKSIIRGIAVVADQYPGHGNDKRHQTNFLGQDTVFFYGSQQMASLIQAPVLYAVVEKVKRGYYTCRLVLVGEPPYSKSDTFVIDNYATALEQSIYHQPEGWLWSHNRWKKRHLDDTLTSSK